jgi:hypothetical protein
MKVPDYVERRIVIEIGRQYAYVYMTAGDGKLLPDREESFKQPYRLDRQEAAEEAVDLWDLVYDHLNDTINWPLPEGGDDGPDSEEED